MNTPHIKPPKIWVNTEFQRLLWLNLSWGMIAGVAIIYALFAFAKGEGISTHESKGDALVVVLDGKGRLTIDGKDYELAKGDSIVMPANHPHAVYGIEAFKMLLVVTFPER